MLFDYKTIQWYTFCMKTTSVYATFFILIALATFASPFALRAEATESYVTPESQMALSPLDGPLVVEIKRQITELKKMLTEFEALTERLSREQNSSQESTAPAHEEIATVPSLTTIPTATVSADLTGDGMVDTHDLKALTASWGPCFESDDCDADLDENGSVDITDLKILLKNWTN
jgi:hypothetical protein